MTSEFLYESEHFMSKNIETEEHFENLIVANSDVIFPHAFLFKFKGVGITRTTEERTHADMCLVSHDCSQWWIIEVELVKTPSYTIEQIQPQIARQADADWSRVTKDVVNIVVEMGANAKDANQLHDIEPKFILLIDDVDDLMLEIAEYHDFKVVAMKPLMGDRGNFALIPMLQQVNPKPPEEAIIRIKRDVIDVRANCLWIPLPKNIKPKLNNNKCLISIDGTHHILPLHPNGKVAIPISKNKNSQSGRLAYRTLKCVFEFEDDDIPNLKFIEEKRWKSG
tara:strand:+ start:153 stop:995 length:843 start_codon:yes stop_codon:yes gene_type:complete